MLQKLLLMKKCRAWTQPGHVLPDCSVILPRWMAAQPERHRICVMQAEMKSVSGRHRSAISPVRMSLMVFSLLPFDLPQPPQWPDAASPVIRLLRCHAADFLWGYALAMALFWVGDRYGHPPGKSIGLSIFADLLMELLQLTPLLSGVFDPWDIFTQILGTGIAACTVADYNTIVRHIKEKGEKQR